MKLALLALFFAPLLRSVEPRSGDKPAATPPPAAHVAPDTSRAWALLVTSVPFERGHFKHDLLAGADVTPDNVTQLKKYLELEFGVKRKIDLVNALDDLTKNGRRVTLNAALKKFTALKLSDKDIDAMKDEKQRRQLHAFVGLARLLETHKDGLLAWDDVRYVMLCRYGYGAGFLTEDEAWRRIGSVTKQVQKTFRSWADLGEVYCAVAEACDLPQVDELRAACKKLATDAESPWKRTPWDLQLGALDKVEAPKETPPKKE